MAKTDRPTAFGEAVRQVRAERGLSQEQAALDGSIDRSYLGVVERGERSPSLTTIWKIADVLGVPPSELLRRAEKIAGR
jgi:transcriptional regulator with XRE-family HTH domain